ncbi:cobyric acid synthase [Heliophilum fasciatum]|uniref:Cobyric acid synthase n=1 Tax=Heliophilum fasciatum TaxID=35700 RepID=A0A4R2RKN8_9FIRM|nr:cobyric acid synthase [Heliophilum fasciatum]MCW2278539.1 adenosylcobyric acid synthase [Heliophilum fasciatum]TCP63494.1 adenosylcobyric acid synthase (glutamine-hydrolysing) [Heliophilum fasciatum]
MAQAIMFQGTSSNVGKSVLAAALCRILYQDGYRVVPFKSQNMALNSYVTKDGGEMGRAQVVQAEAAGIEPSVEMNPILLKPTGQASSQVVLLGKPIGTYSARDYHLTYAPQALATIAECLEKLHTDYDMIVIEGAGSPAEVNLKARDIANMRVAKMAKAPVLLVADIDRGGALASVVGTLALLDPDEQALIRGIVINKFRGDRSLLQPALDFLEEKTGIPVVGVIPYFRGIALQEEDSVVLEKAETKVGSGEVLDIAVIRLPRISNFTDFDALSLEGTAHVRFVEHPEQLGQPDMVILPGTKNTIADMRWLEGTGLATAVRDFASRGKLVWGICGGYQMLGQRIDDPQGVEGDVTTTAGLGLLPMITTMEAEKITERAESILEGHGPFLGPLAGMRVTGYEIHMGRSEATTDVRAFGRIVRRGETSCDAFEGMVEKDGLVIGTYLHGIFDNSELRRGLFNELRRKRGWAPLAGAMESALERRQQDYDRLADVVRQNIDMERIYRWMREGVNVNGQGEQADQQGVEGQEVVREQGAVTDGRHA